MGLLIDALIGIDSPDDWGCESAASVLRAAKHLAEVHWLAYGAAAHPVYFLSGWLFAWAFMWAGLPAALAAHGGENFGSSMLGTLSAFVR